MRLLADGQTPVSRMVLVDDLEVDGGYAFVPRSPFFLVVGDRLEIDNHNVVVTHADGTQSRHPGGWETRCRGIGRRPWQGDL